MLERKTIFFFSTMAGSTALTLLRSVAVAAILTPEKFGLYALTIAIGMFCSSLLGMGQVQASIKEFPRSWDNGTGKLMLASIDKVLKSITLHAMLAALILSPAMYFVHADGPVLAILAAGYALFTAALSLFSSAHRSTGNITQFGLLVLFRSVLAIGLSIFGAWHFGLAGAIVGELFAAAIAIAMMRLLVSRATRIKEVVDTSGAAEELLTGAGGRWLLFALILNSAPVYLDRWFISVALGDRIAGQYGFLLLVVTGSIAAFAIVAQKVGPELVRAAHRGATPSQQLQSVVPLVSLVCLLIVFATLLVGLIWETALLPATLARYNLTLANFMLAAALGLLQVTAIVDWFLLANDREKDILIASLANVLGSAIAATVILIWQPALQMALLAISGAKLCHLAAQIALSMRYFVRSQS